MPAYQPIRSASKSSRALARTYKGQSQLDLGRVQDLGARVLLSLSGAHGREDLAAVAPDHVELWVEQQQVAREREHLRLVALLRLPGQHFAGHVVVHAHLRQLCMALVVRLLVLLLALHALYAAVHLVSRSPWLDI